MRSIKLILTNRYFLLQNILIVFLMLSPLVETKETFKFEQYKLLFYRTFNSETKSFRESQNVLGANITKGQMGRFGEAVLLGQSSDILEYFAWGNFPYSYDSSEGTMSFWLKLKPDDWENTKTGKLFELDELNANEPGIQLSCEGKLENDSVLCAIQFTLFSSQVKDASGEQSSSSIQTLSANEVSFFSGEWRMVSVTWKISRMNDRDSFARIYIDGEKRSEIIGFSYPIQWEKSDQKFRLGSGLACQIDDFALLAKALSSREIKKLYKNPEGVAGMFLSKIRN